MEQLLKKYAEKLVDQGLVDAPGPLLGGLDADVTWNRPDPMQPLLREVISGLDISAILFARPAEPYFSLINRLVERMPPGTTSLCPQDSENRTFLHELPVVCEPTAARILRALKHRKCAIIPRTGVVTHGTVSPEQAYIVYSSVCFSLFVKAFVDAFEDRRNGRRDPALEALVMRGKNHYQACLQAAENHAPLMRGPFSDEQGVLEAICQVGRLTVAKRMVDSYFGNVSYRLGETVYISQTASSLDDLAGAIDPCALDDSRCTAITASSEYPAHKSVYLHSGHRAILHGHPKFSVIASLMCEHRKDCENSGDCHTRCSRDRRVGGVPILPGESGTGPHGIATTLPAPLAREKAAVIYGHGVFTVGEHDFTDAFQRLVDVEKACFNFYVKQFQTNPDACHLLLKTMR